jgi:hypothetical protein
MAKHIRRELGVVAHQSICFPPSPRFLQSFVLMYRNVNVNSGIERSVIGTPYGIDVG